MTTGDSIVDLIATKVAEQADADRPILTFVHVAPDGSLADETRSYAQLDGNGGALAGWLSAQGVRTGDCFALMMNNHPEFVEAMVAGARLGASWVPIDARSMGDKLVHMLSHVPCRGVIAADYCLGTLAQVATGIDALEWILVVGDTSGAQIEGVRVAAYDEALECPAPPPAVIDPAAPMYYMYTSGTTGKPKAVAHSHGQFMATAGALAAMGVGPGDVIHTGLSLAHVNAQGSLRTGLALGLPTVIGRKFSKSRLWDICRTYGCTVFSLLGGMIPEVFAAPPRPDDANNPVRLIISAGMPESLWRAYRERFGVEICEVYGATEAGGAMLNLPGGPAGSLGKPDPFSDVAVLDEQDRPLGPGEPGELCFRRKNGDPIKIAYYNDPEASDEKVRNGWFRTGDIVHYDKDGWFYFHHRVGGGVRRNGDFVNTALVESVISRSPLVDDVFVFGVALPHNVAGEKTLVAMVVPSDPDQFDADELLAECQAQLERNDVPEIVHPTHAIPKTVSEKPIERDAIALLRRERAIPG